MLSEHPLRGKPKWSYLKLIGLLTTCCILLQAVVWRILIGSFARRAWLDEVVQHLHLGGLLESPVKSRLGDYRSPPPWQEFPWLIIVKKIYTQKRRNHDSLFVPLLLLPPGVLFSSRTRRMRERGFGVAIDTPGLALNTGMCWRIQELAFRDVNWQCRWKMWSMTGLQLEKKH